MNPRRHILTAALLLIAGALALGGPVAIHLLGHHAPAEAATQCCSSSGDLPTLPANNDELPSDDCPECDLLTTIALGDTTSATSVALAADRWTPTPQPGETQARDTERDPRTSRGPPRA